MLTRENELDFVKSFDGKVVDEDEFDEIVCCSVVVKAENCGESGKYINHSWYYIILDDNTSISVYMKWGCE